MNIILLKYIDKVFGPPVCFVLNIYNQVKKIFVKPSLVPVNRILLVKLLGAGVKYIQQKGGYKAFIPEKFTPSEMLLNEPKIIKLLANANLQFGKLDGLTKLLPYIDFFISMYINKEAAYSS